MVRLLRSVRAIVLCILLAGIAAGAVMLAVSPQGRQIVHHPQIIGNDVRRWVQAHPIVSPAVLGAAFVLLSVLMLPVWWLEVLAGCALGLVMGIVWCDLAGAVAAGATWSVSNWLAGDFVRQRVEARLERLRRWDQMLGHNGLLVVMAVRLVHVAPFALSNYLFGLVRVSLADVAVGTLLGNLPAVSLYVALGYDAEMVRRPAFIGYLVGLSIVLLVPLALRYWRPDWFGRLGIE